MHSFSYLLILLGLDTYDPEMRPVRGSGSQYASNDVS